MGPGVSTPSAVFATRPGLLCQRAGDPFFSRVAIAYPLSRRADSAALIPAIVCVPVGSPTCDMDTREGGGHRVG